jgi:glycosyltransferase involved in cell wall biosynthesis
MRVAASPAPTRFFEVSHYMSVTSAAVGDLSSLPQAIDSSRPLRVLQVIASVADVNGGASTAIWATLKALRNRSINSELVTTNEDGLHRLMDVPMGEFIRRGDDRVRFFPARGDRYTTSWPLAKWLVAHVRDYDLVHVHGLFRFAPVAAAHIALARGVPYVLTPHNTLGRWGMQNRRPLLKKLSMGLVEGRVINGARRVHLCSADELAQASQFWQLGARPSVFPLGIELPPDTTDHDPSNTEVARSLDELAGRTVVLFMSRIHEIKGVDALITAFAAVRRRHPDAVLAIAGNGDKRLIARLKELARELGVSDCTHWLGFVQGRDKQRLLSLATVFVLPSHSENFGYAVVEAMLAGLVVVTTVNVPSGSFITEADSGIVYDGTLGELQKSVLTVLEMPADRRRELGSRAASTVRDRLSLQSFGDCLEKLYRDAAAAR